LPSLSSTTYAYDNAQRLTNIRHPSACGSGGQLQLRAGWKSDLSQISSFAYGYDAVGNRTGVVEGNGDRVTWSYDALYQLTRERRSGDNAYDITYSYDPVGNRLTKLTGGVTTTYSYDGANELLTENAGGTVTTYSYDNNGNTRLKNAAGSVTTYTWDGENRLIKLESADGTFTMTYDADGLRRKKEEASATTNFIWDGLKVRLESDAGNSTVVEYTLSEQVYGDLVSQRRGQTSSFYHFDALGSTDRLTGSDGSVTDSYVYEGFGSLKASTGSTTNRYRYVGRLGYYGNGTDLLYLRARHYVLGLGRYLSRPGGIRGAYVFAGNGPGRGASSRRADPSWLPPPPPWWPEDWPWLGGLLPAPMPPGGPVALPIPGHEEWWPYDPEQPPPPPKPPPKHTVIDCLRLTSNYCRRLGKLCFLIAYKGPPVLPPWAIFYIYCEEDCKVSCDAKCTQANIDAGYWPRFPYLLLEDRCLNPKWAGTWGYGVGPGGRWAYGGRSCPL